MMIEPPIDKLIDIIGCKYALVCITSKRVRELLDKKRGTLDASGIKPVTFASKEIYERKITVGND